MSLNLLNKGIEIELYAGEKSGKVLPLSSKLSSHFREVSQEPDQRNFEYITTPTTNYTTLLKEILIPRIKIREYLKSTNDYTLIPGSTMALPFSKEFYFSKPEDPYHQYISKEYKTSVVTTSLHLNFGIEDSSDLFKLLCALRLDTTLFLALSASSCFHDGNVTDYHSFRWKTFPKTPAFIPFFTCHDEYIFWINEQLKNKTMQNVRHLWTSIRPNGPDRPYNLNRIEIRICDFISNLNHVLAVVAFIEAIIQNYLLHKQWPKIILQSQSQLNQTVNLIEEQEELSAKNSLNAEIWDWRRDTKSTIREIISNVYKDITNIGKNTDLDTYLKFIPDILEHGNEAMNLLNSYKSTKSIEATIQCSIENFNKMDMEILKNLETKPKEKNKR